VGVAIFPLMQMLRPSKLHTIHHISFGRVDLRLHRYIFLFLFGFRFWVWVSVSVQFVRLLLLSSGPGQIGGPAFNGLCDKGPQTSFVPSEYSEAPMYVSGFVCPICSKSNCLICAHINKVTLEP